MIQFVKKKVSEIDEPLVKIIHDFILQNNGLVFHEVPFNRIVSGCYKTSLNYILVYLKNHELIALCPLHIYENGLLKTFLTKMPSDTPYGGWVYNSDHINLKNLLSYFKKIGPNEKIIYTSNLFVNEDIRLEKITKQQTAIIDLSVNENEIWEKSLTSKKRNKIRKALKTGITIESIQNPDQINEIWPLFENLHEKISSSNNYLKSFYDETLEYYIQKDWAKILVAKKSSQIISAVMLIGNNNVIHYWKGAKVANAINEGQGELLQWEAIKWAIARKSKFYDLCVINKSALPGIYEFKTGFSTNIFEYFTYTSSKLFYKSYNRIQKWFLKL